jgi:hypothetical protein
LQATSLETSAQRNQHIALTHDHLARKALNKQSNKEPFAMPLDVYKTEATNDPVIQNAINAPRIFFEASAGKADGGNRAKGVFLTKEELVSLRLYELAGLRLPTHIQDVIAYLGFKDGAGRGLSAEDFRITYITIRNHAARWNPIRVKLMAVGSELKVFAGQMLQYGKIMEGVLTEVQGDKTLTDLGIRTIEDLKRVKIQMGNRFPGIELSPADLDVVEDFGFYLEKILTRLAQRKKDAEEIKNLLHQFGNDLSLHVRPQISIKLQAITNTSLTADVKQLTERIEQRALDIDQKIKEYKQAVTSSLTSASKLNPFGVAMAIYTGVEAEKIRKERNHLKGLQETDIQSLTSKNSILGNLSRVQQDMQELQLLVIDADSATKNLITAWNSLYLYVEQSHIESSEITDALRARRFVSHFSLVVKPWELIGMEADDLLTVFKEADDEIARRGLN